MIGKYYRSQNVSKQNSVRFNVAKIILANNPFFDKIFSNFDIYDAKNIHLIQNAILMACLPRRTKGINPRLWTELHKFELLLHAKNYTGWPTRKKHEFSTSLTSKDYAKSASVLSELRLASELSSIVGISNVQLYPKLLSGRISDIAITLKTKNVYFEVGFLGISQPEIIIE